MIQRIQTIYLLIVTALQSILFFSNIATASLSGGAVAVAKLNSYLPMAILVGVSALLAFFSIFLYKKRVMQIRINIYNLIILLAIQGYLIYYIIKFTHKYENISYSIPTIFPIISAIFTFLAIRNIGKDEALIKALNRIR